MFFIKRKGKRIPIEDPIYTTCPMCGLSMRLTL